MLILDFALAIWPSVNLTRRSVRVQPHRLVQSHRLVLRIPHPPVIDGGQRLHEAVFDRLQLRQRQAAFVELAVEEPLHRQVVHQAFNAGRRRVGQSAAGAFDDVGQHEDGSLFRLRLGPRIAERALVEVAGIRIGLQPLGLAAVEVLDQRCAVVLLDEVDDRMRQRVLTGQIDAILDVGNDHQRAHRGLERLVPVPFGSLVLDEVRRLEHLADVVEVGPHADEQPIAADRLGGSLGNRGDVDRVVVGSGRSADELLQQRMLPELKLPSGSTLMYVLVVESVVLVVHLPL